jgi:hypothetical protein
MIHKHAIQVYGVEQLAEVTDPGLSTMTRLELQEDKLNILSDFAEKSLRMTNIELCSKTNGDRILRLGPSRDQRCTVGGGWKKASMCIQNMPLRLIASYFPPFECI